MKSTLRVLAVVLVVAVLGALMLVGAGCSKDDDTSSSDTTTTETTETDNSGTTESEGTTVADATAGEETLAGACTECHDLKRVYLLQTPMPDWNTIVSTMEEAHGAVLTDQEKADVVAYLEVREAAAAEQLIRGKCTTCHDTTRIYEKDASTDWDAVLKTMVETHGAELTPQEQSDIAAYLSSL